MEMDISPQGAGAEASFLNISSHLMSNRWPTLELNSLHCLLISRVHFRSISLIRVVPNL